MRKTIIVDIDGTLCDISQRLHLIKDPSQKAWDKFFEAIPNDEPRLDIISLVNNLARGYKISLVSGRPDNYHQETFDWLRKYQVLFDSIHMRKAGDMRADTIVKNEILNANFNLSDIFMVIDDRPRVIKMWRDNGLLVLDVGKGIDF